MKKICVILILCSCFSAASQQRRPDSVMHVDTVKLSLFEANKILRFSFNGVRIEINAEDYISEMKTVYRKNKRYYKFYKKSSNPFLDPEIFLNNIELMDSIAVFAKSRKKPGISSQMGSIFEIKDTKSPVHLREFINDDNCAIYDENGVRQFIILIKRVDVDCGYNCISGFEGYYLIDQENCFLEISRWVT